MALHISAANWIIRQYFLSFWKNIVKGRCRNGKWIKWNELELVTNCVQCDALHQLMFVYWCPSRNYPHRYSSALTFLNENMKTSFPCCKSVVFSMDCGVVATAAAAAAAAEVFPINSWWFNHTSMSEFYLILFRMFFLQFNCEFMPSFSIQLPVWLILLQYRLVHVLHCVSISKLKS